MSGRRWLVVLVGLMGCDPKGTDDSGQDGESLAGTDADGDGFAADVDCNDSDPAVHPEADEVCDGADNDCDGLIDDADETLVDDGTLVPLYVDGDGDGYGAGAVALHGCASGGGFSTRDDDCDDTAASVFPDADEVCDGVDNDCDGLADDADDSVDLTTGEAVYDDLDGDGFGDDATVRQACAPAEGEVLKGGDCDDTIDQVYPGAREWCDGLDNDCDEATAEDGTASWLGTDGFWSDWTATLAGDGATVTALDLLDPGTLYVCAGIWPVSLQIGADVDLVGPAGSALTTLSGGGAARVLAVPTDGVSVSVSGVTITDGIGAKSIDFTDGYGGGVLCEGASSLSLEAVDITGNTTGTGAGLLSIGCTVTLKDSSVRDNTATDACGGACAFGGALTLRDSTVRDNTANFAGGLMAYGYAGDDAELLLLSTRVEGNAAFIAAGLYVYGGAASCSGDKGAGNGGFLGNSASLTGGAVYVNNDGTVASSFASVLCDFGDSASGDDNTPKDIAVGTLLYSYGQDETFTCTTAGCR